ncbi:MAG TPA: hypothetical protein VGB55_03210, partial [Tepidisphaeraceae bacterium]
QFYAPLALLDDPLRATLTDESTGELLASWPTRESIQLNYRMGFGGEQVGFLALTSGRLPAWAAYRRATASGTSIVVHRPLPQLPSAAVGYDSLDVLLLNEPDWSKVSIEQQTAMIHWVRGGGTLMIWPGIDPLPADGPVAAAAPADLGGLSVLDLSATLRAEIGLRPEAQIAARELSPRPRSQTIPMLGRAEGVSQTVGLGKIVLLPIDPAGLTFLSADQSDAYWTTFFDRTLGAAAIDAAAQEASQAAVQQHAASFQPPKQPFPVTMPLLALAAAGLFLAGPIDFLLLRKLGQSSKTISTVLASVLFLPVAGGLIYASQQPAQESLQAIEWVDQAGGSVVGRVALSRTPSALEEGNSMWWSGASLERSPGSGFPLPLATRQTPTSNLPAAPSLSHPLTQGKSFAPEPGMIDATLRIDGNALTGTVVNRSEQPLINIVLRHHGRESLLAERLEAGAAVSVNIAAPADNQAAPAPAGRNDFGGMFDLDAARSAAVRRAEADGAVVIMAKMLDPSSNDGQSASLSLLRSIHRLQQ